MSMKFAVALALAASLLLSAPAALLSCDLAKAPHDCCPKSGAKAACPYDVLAAAKAPRPPDGAAPVALASAPVRCVEAPNSAPQHPAQFALDDRDLHTRIRVLLI